MGKSELVWQSLSSSKQSGGANGRGGAYIGIDLGTSNSCVALWHAGKHRAKIIKCQDKRTTPSVVYFKNEKEWVVGEAALNAAMAGDGVPVSAVKRVIGLDLADPTLKDVVLPFGLSESLGSGKLLIEAKAGNGLLVRRRPEEISAMVLSTLRQAVMDYLIEKPFPDIDSKNDPVDRVVLTVPAHFHEAQKEATRQAAVLAGFQEVVLLTEPFAAAMAYGLFVAGTKNVLTFDMGGGTTDVSVLHLSEGSFEVLALGGDNRLGGEDMDEALVEYVLQESKLPPTSLAAIPPVTRARLKRAVSLAKIALSTEEKAGVDISWLHPGLLKPIKPSITMTRQVFEEQLIPHLIDRAKRIVEETLKGAQLEAKEIDEIVLVGGCSRVPAIRKMLESIFGPKKELFTGVNADEAVAEGAAIRGAILSGIDPAILRDILMIDAIPLDIGLETADGGLEVMLVKNSSIPCQATKYFELAEEGQQTVSLRILESTDDGGSIRLASFDCPVEGHVFLQGEEGEDEEENDDQEHLNHKEAEEKKTQPPEDAVKKEEEREKNGIGKGRRATKSLVPVTLKMGSDCILRVWVGDDAARGDQDPVRAPLNPQSLVYLFLLTLYCTIFVALYVVLKVYFADSLAELQAVPSGSSTTSTINPGEGHQEL